MDQEFHPELVLDLRKIAAPERRTLVFDRFNHLQPGEALELTHFHHSTPLHYLLLAEAPRGFSWEYLQQGPELWRIRIRKNPLAAAAQSSGAELLH